MLIFVPVSADDLHSLMTNGLHEVEAHAVTPELLAGLGLGPDLEEDGEYAAMLYASVACLTRHDQRCVVVADVSSGVTDSGDDFGRIKVAAVGTKAVRSIFIDEDEAAALVAAAASGAHGKDLEAAWELDAVQTLLAEADLLWHDVEESSLVLQILAGRS